MDNIKIAKELLAVAKELTADRKRESKLMNRQQNILDKWLETSEGERAVSRGHVFYDDLPDGLRRQLERVKDQETLWSDVERYLSDVAMNKRYNSGW